MKKPEIHIQATQRKAHSIDYLVGERITYFRKRHSLSLTQLATDAGITHQQLAKYEQAKNRVPASRLHAISELLAVPISAFFQDEHDVMNVTHIPEEGQKLLNYLSDYWRK